MSQVLDDDITTEPSTNRQVVLAARPHGKPKPSDFRQTTAAVPAVGNGQVLVRNLIVSLDPYQRGIMGGAVNGESLEIGQVINGAAVARVEQSRHADFSIGDHVVGFFGWQDYAVAPGETLRSINSVDAPLSASLGILGFTGLTAWAGMCRILKPQAGETVVVSGAAGAVGSVAGQIAKLMGARVVGIAGGPDKVSYIVGELGFDVGVDYQALDFADQLARATPDGIDVIFENVGGSVLDATLSKVNESARVAICGVISQYNAKNGATHRSEHDVLSKIMWERLSVRGFSVLNYVDQIPQFLEDVGGWLKEGKLVHATDLVEGLDAIPAAFPRLFEGRTRGKLVARIVSDADVN